MSTTRRLREDEKQLIRWMLRDLPQGRGIVETLDGYEVSEMTDGGMGSVRTAGLGGEARRFGKILSTVELADEDGTPLMASVIVDTAGELYELDIWKVDFTPLKRFPQLR